MTGGDLSGLHGRFLAWLLDWHAAEGGETDFEVLARRLDLQVREGHKSSYDNERRRIIIARSSDRFRRRHEGLHEVVHFLFKNAQDGAFLQAALSLGGARMRSQKDIEEGIVAPATLHLLIPPVHLRAALESEDSDVEAIVQLARRCRTSFGMAGRRYVQELTRPLRGLIIASNNRVDDAFGNGVGKGRYVPGRGVPLDATHPLCGDLPFNEPVPVRTNIPFKNSRRTWPTTMYVLRDRSRMQTVAVFDSRKIAKAASLFDTQNLD